MVWTVLLLLDVAATIAAVPIWWYSRAWSSVPAGVGATLILLLFALDWLNVITIWHPWPTPD